MAAERSVNRKAVQTGRAHGTNDKERARKSPKDFFRRIWYVINGDSRSGDMSLPFFIYVMVLLVIGLVMMSSASYAWAYSDTGDGLHYAKLQGIYAVVGVVSMLLVMNIDYHNYKKIRIPFIRRLNLPGVLYAVGAILLILVLFIGNDEGGSMGAKRWFQIGQVNVQPTEIAKLTLIIYFAYNMERDGKYMNRFGVGIAKYVVLLGFYVALIIPEKHISGIVLLTSIAIVMILCGGANLKQFIALGIGAAAAVAGYIIVQYNDPESYVRARILSWLHPFDDMLGDTWQTANSLIAIGSGGLFGLGLGNSRQKYLYLPETKNDFVFPIVCEELGFVGALAIIMIFLLLVVEGYSIAARSRDRFGMLIAVGITTQIGIQTVFNLAVVSNLIPNTGISLPFFSYGGSALIMQLVEMGIMLNISQQRYIPPRRDDDDPLPPQPVRRSSSAAMIRTDSGKKQGGKGSRLFSAVSRGKRRGIKQSKRDK